VAFSLSRLITIVETPEFARVLRSLSLVAAVTITLSEVASYLSPEFPKDTLGTAVMVSTFVVVAGLTLLSLPRRIHGLGAMLCFAVLGWYLSRVLGSSGGILSPHQGAVYMTLIAANALLAFSVLEFVGTTVLFTGAFMISSLVTGKAEPADYTVVLFYIVGFTLMGSVGTWHRTRLQLAERDARQEQERISASLQTEVQQQVDQIHRAELLGRYLPPELSEAVMQGERGPELSHGRREVAALCAVPAGFLETLTDIAPDQVGPLVNHFVTAMTHVAHDHGGVIERFVGPRITVLFGAIGALEPDDSARRAMAMAVRMQEETNLLIQQWEGSGLASIRLRLAIGVACGPAVVGTFGSERRVEYTALGGATVRANRLAGDAIPGEVRLDARTHDLLAGTLEVLPGDMVEFVPGEPRPTFVLAPSAATDLGAITDSLELRMGTLDGMAWTAQATEAMTPEAESRNSWETLGALPKLKPGTLFDGRYRIEAKVGRGGMAVVYRARHLVLEELRAIKLIAAERLTGPRAVEQFRREAESTARIRNPNVVQLIDFGRSIEGYYYLALEYVDGPSLSQLLQDHGPLAEADAVRIGVDILSALEAAHWLRIVHRDLKPANVLLTSCTPPQRGRARVADFGLAQNVGRGGHSSQMLMTGTPLYMSPEQMRGERLDERSDLYAFGVTLYEMLTGHSPYRSTSGLEALVLAMRDPPVPIEERAPQVSGQLKTVIERCMAKSRDDRPESAAEVRTMLERLGVDASP